MIEFNNISKKCGETFELKIDKLKLDNNNIYALLGENGAGKTTTIRIMLGLLRPDNGSVLYNKKDIIINREIKGKIGYVPDAPILYESLTGLEQIRFISNLYGSMDEEYIRELMSWFRIDDKKNELICNYSKGMKQKISIICALIHKPEVLVLDEPFTGLDPSMIKQMKELLRQYVTIKNHIVIFSTHDLDVADAICTNAVILSKGRVAIIEDKDTISKKKIEEIYFEYT